MKKWPTYLLLLLFLGSSCGKKASNNSANNQDTTGQHTKLLDTVTKDTTDTLQHIEQEIKLNDIPSTKEVKDLLKYFRDKYAVNYVEIPNESSEVHVLDRFSCEKKYQLILSKKCAVMYGKVEDIYPVIHLRAYVYADSAQCANALNNWINCFGNDCNQIELKQPTTIKSTPGYYIINTNSIVCLDYKVEHQENNWELVINHLKRLFAVQKSIKIRVKPQGKLIWE